MPISKIVGRTRDTVNTPYTVSNPRLVLLTDNYYIPICFNILQALSKLIISNTNNYIIISKCVE